MRIAFVLDDSLDRPDGVQQYVLTVGKWLKQNGHEVFYLVGQTSRQDVENIHSLSKIVRVKFNGNVVGTPLPANKKALKRLLDELKLDVIHVQLPYSPVLAGRVVDLASRNTAVVGTLHIYPNTKFEHGMNKLLAGINAKTLKQFDEIIAVSEAAAAASHINSANKIQIIPNPVDIKRFSAPRQAGSQIETIKFLGRLVPRKGCMILLQALDLLKSTGKLPADLQIEIGGTGPLLAKLEQYAKAKALTDQISFKGYIEESNKPGFLQTADIAVYPSSGGESFGIVLIEAMAAGAITLGGNNTGYACVMGKESSQLFDTKNAQDLADKLAVLLGNESMQASVKKHQKQLVKQFDIDQVGSALMSIYKKTLRSKRNMP